MKRAILFPGQGSQSVGMLAGFDAPIVQQTLAEASDALGWDLAAIVRDGPEDRLNDTRITQPAVLAASTALWRLLQERSGTGADALAGHSLGEYSALVAAQSLTFTDALRLVARRGELMQLHAPAGAGMTAVIGLDDAAVETLCADCPDGALYPVNYNAPGQVVVAGEVAALAWLDSHAKPAGARMVSRLAMSVPSHCPMLRDAAVAFADALDATDIRDPIIPVVHNIDAQPRSRASDIRSALSRQLCEPVRWTQTQQYLVDAGLTEAIECGPGKVLTGLAKRSMRGITCLPLATPEGMDAAVEHLSTADAQEKPA